VVQPASASQLPGYRGLKPVIPEGAVASLDGLRYVDLPPWYVAPMYQSPVADELLGEWPGGTRVTALGMRFDDGRAPWQLVSDPASNEGWIAELYLDADAPVEEPPTAEAYLSAVTWDGEITLCINPTGGPAGLDDDRFVALVEAAVWRWQRVTDDALPLVSRGRCEHDPNVRGDRVNAVGWADDLGLVIAGQAWPNADRGTISEVDILLSRGYFERLHVQHPERSLRGCVFSTVLHELGHLLGLNHPRSRLLPSTMQAVGASRCDKGQPSPSDRQNLLQRYGPGRTE